MTDKFVLFERSSFLGNIFLAYRDFSNSFRMLNSTRVSERTLLFLAFTGTVILFMANIPVQVATSQDVVDVDAKVYLGLITFVSIFFIPLFLYFVSGLLFVLLRLFGGLATFTEFRLALFWAVNVSGPLLVLNGLLTGFFYKSVAIEYVSIALQSFIAWIISSMLVEAEQFRSKLPTFLATIGLIWLPHFLPLLSI